MPTCARRRPHRPGTAATATVMAARMRSARARRTMRGALLDIGAPSRFLGTAQVGGVIGIGRRRAFLSGPVGDRRMMKVLLDVRQLLRRERATAEVLSTRNPASSVRPVPMVTSPVGSARHRIAWCWRREPGRGVRRGHPDRRSSNRSSPCEVVQGERVRRRAEDDAHQPGQQPLDIARTPLAREEVKLSAPRASRDLALPMLRRRRAGPSLRFRRAIGRAGSATPASASSRSGRRSQTA